MQNSIAAPAALRLLRNTLSPPSASSGVLSRHRCRHSFLKEDVPFSSRPRPPLLLPKCQFAMDSSCCHIPLHFHLCSMAWTAPWHSRFSSSAEASEALLPPLDQNMETISQESSKGTIADDSASKLTCGEEHSSLDQNLLNTLEANSTLEEKKIDGSNAGEEAITGNQSKFSEPNSLEQAIHLDEPNSIAIPTESTESDLIAETTAEHQSNFKFSARLDQLENVVEQQGRSIASLTLQLEEHKLLFASVLRDIKLVKTVPGGRVPNPVPSVSEGQANSSMSKWPEWASFLQHLSGLPFFKEVSEAAEIGHPVTFDDPITVKRTLSKLSQAYASIFEYLSAKHLRVLAEYGCPNDDQRTVASAKRLRNHFQMKEKNDVCDSNFSKPANVNAKLSDVMRLIYTMAEVSISKKGEAPANVKASILHLLKEITNMTSKHEEERFGGQESVLDTRSKLQELKNRKSEIVEAKVCEEGGSIFFTAEKKKGQLSDRWKCPRCAHMNRQSKSKCVECNFERQEKTVFDVDDSMQESNLALAKRRNTEGNASSNVKEAKEDVILASENYNGALATEREGLVGVQRESAAEQPQQEAEIPTLLKEDKKDLGDGLRDDFKQGEANKETALATMKSLILENEKGTAISEREGLVNVLGKKSAEEEQMPTIFLEEDKTKLSDELDSDAAGHSDIFDDIFKSDDSSLPLAEQDTGKKCSLSELVRQNLRAFSSPRKEREQDEYEKKGGKPFNGKGWGDDDLDVNSKRRPSRAEQDDLGLETEDEDEDIQPDRSSARRTSSRSSMEFRPNRSSDRKGGLGEKGLSGRTYGDERRKSYKEGRSRGEDFEVEFGSDRRSSRTRGAGDDRSKFKEDRPRRKRGGGGYSDDEFEESGSRLERGDDSMKIRRREGKSRY